MRRFKAAVGGLLLMLSTSVWAFMPASGLWGIDSENTGQPGRGFNIEVQNEIVVFTYYGYRADGSSTFYIAAGPIINNVFSSALTEYQGGTALGGAYNPAASNGSVGTVTLSFTSGRHGTITLPGESTKAIFKNNFGYADGADGLLGTWVFTQIVGSTPYAQRKILTVNTGISTSNGNGIVTNAAQDFLCEFNTSGALAGQVICSDPPGTIGQNLYGFKFSGDRGTGTSFFILSGGGYSSFYESDALRTATKSGARTGLNNGTYESVQAYAVTSRPLSTSSSISAPDPLMLQAKESADTYSSSAVGDPAKAAALAAWSDEVRALIPLKH